MKMHRLDYLALQDAIFVKFNANHLTVNWLGYKAKGLSARRFRWDVLHASGFNTGGLYNAGLNDAHIDTALRRILQDVTS